MRQLCDVSDVKRVFNTIGRFTDAEILEEIDEQSDDIYNECGDPLAGTNTLISKKNSEDDYYLKYYLGEKRIHHVERVFVGTVTKREVYEGTDFEVAKNVGMIKFNSSTVGGSRFTTEDDATIYYVPNLYAKYCALRVAQALLEKSDIVLSGKSSKELEVIENKLARQETLISQRIGITFSSDYQNYDSEYGINTSYVEQNHDMNEYMYRADTIYD